MGNKGWMGRWCLLSCWAVLHALPALADSRVLTIGVEALDYAPYYYLDSNGNYRGLARDVLDAFARRQGYVFVYKPMPTARLMHAFLAEQSVDFKFPDHPRWSVEARRGVLLSYSLPLVTLSEGLLVRAPHQPLKLEQLHNMATLTGFTPVAYLDQLHSGQIRLTENSSQQGLLRQLLVGRVQAVYLDWNVGMRMARSMAAAGQLEPARELPVDRVPLMLSSTRYPEIIDQFNQFLQQQAGLLQRLRQHYHLSE
ncbi:substrate-binding periplasmic protein [Aquitalea magnusonii]|uniref:ABC-type amino acid transport substrate-binding protein n=1 Tax=Aquitalea magnusonii TaxID=332411 RepID=A0A318J690_9NEIS|nr:transporter substrate-binding domain-containing protein [Aquitalea magnusonii]PXX43409.1 ABC-type amino acid transport substrate-binding protein [Aquitalea magnusonii]